MLLWEVPPELEAIWAQMYAVTDRHRRLELSKKILLSWLIQYTVYIVGFQSWNWKVNRQECVFWHAHCITIPQYSTMETTSIGFPQTADNYSLQNMAANLTNHCPRKNYYYY